MPQDFDNKDYGGYFHELERSLEKKEVLSRQESAERKTAPKAKFKGAVISIKKLRGWVKVCAVLLLVTLIATIVIVPLQSDKKGDKSKLTAEHLQEILPKKEVGPFVAKADGQTIILGDQFEAKNIVFIDVENNRIVAQKNSNQKCYPASTTKIMTLLVAVEMIKDYDDTFEMTYEITDPLFNQNATVAGFLAGEKINMTDLLYGTILPSGADATIALATKLCGTEENFVKEMNKKAKQLGLKDTNFKNSSGLFEEGHYTTAEDLAVILRAAMENELCKKILSTYKHTAKPTAQHPEGLEMKSTLFESMYGDEPEGAVILGGKTGFVNESGYCIASFGENETSKKQFACIVLGSEGKWPAVYAQIDLYSQYAK